MQNNRNMLSEWLHPATRYIEFKDGRWTSKRAHLFGDETVYEDQDNMLSGIIVDAQKAHEGLSLIFKDQAELDKLLRSTHWRHKTLLAYIKSVRERYQGLILTLDEVIQQASMTFEHVALNYDTENPAEEVFTARVRTLRKSFGVPPLFADRLEAQLRACLLEVVAGGSDAFQLLTDLETSSAVSLVSLRRPQEIIEPTKVTFRPHTRDGVLWHGETLYGPVCVVPEDPDYPIIAGEFHDGIFYSNFGSYEFHHEEDALIYPIPEIAIGSCSCRSLDPDVADREQPLDTLVAHGEEQ